MNKIIITIGISASGKSTWAKKYIKDEKNAVIISRDSIRMSLFGYNEKTIKDYYNLPDFKDNEDFVTNISDSLIRKSLSLGKDVIIDNTHLREQYINHYKSFGYPITLKWFDVDVSTAIKRDANRDASVGSGVIANQSINFTKLNKKKITEDINSFNDKLDYFLTNAKKRPYNPTKQDCIIWDMDGTLCHANGRGYFEYKKVGDDISDVAIESLHSYIYDTDDFNLKSIILTGRSDECLEETSDWLKENLIHFDEIYMRDQKDFRKDWIVKAEHIIEIQKKYNIVCIFDDRNQVVSFMRNLGFKTLQVQEEN